MTKNKKKVLMVDFYDQRSAATMNFGALQSIFDKNAEFSYINLANKESINVDPNIKYTDEFDIRILATDFKQNKNRSELTTYLKNLDLITPKGNLNVRRGCDSVFLWGARDIFEKENVAVPPNEKINLELVNYLNKYMQIPKIEEILTEETESEQEQEHKREKLIAVIPVHKSQKDISLNSLNKIFNPIAKFEYIKSSYSEKLINADLRLWTVAYLDPDSITSNSKIYSKEEILYSFKEMNEKLLYTKLKELHEKQIKNYLEREITQIIEKTNPETPEHYCLEEYGNNKQTAKEMINLFNEEIQNRLEKFKSKKDIIWGPQFYDFRGVVEENLVARKSSRISSDLVQTISQYITPPFIEEILSKPQQIKIYQK